ncbi:MAG: hypothetical protein NTX73_00660 [Rhodobacterales bacterium]|nr:hypothetical protein [Rhodobacterales bacterium]
MQVMVLEQDQGFQAQLATALMAKGFHVICVESAGAAENFIRMSGVDVLVLGERIGGKLSHPVALLAECRNPAVSAILLTERKGEDLDEVFDLLPAVYAILGRGIAPGVVAQIVVSATNGLASETVQRRLGSHWPLPESIDESIDDPDAAGTEQSEEFVAAPTQDTAPAPAPLPETASSPAPVTVPNALAALAERLRASPARSSEWWTAAPEGTLSERRIRALPSLEDLTPAAGAGGPSDRRLHLQ